jgi:hypothetical protein
MLLSSTAIAQQGGRRLTPLITCDEQHSRIDAEKDDEGNAIGGSGSMSCRVALSLIDASVLLGRVFALVFFQAMLGIF